MDNSILTLPFVPLRGIVVFPKLLSNIDIGREKSLAAVDYAMEHDRLMIVSAQLDEDEETPVLTEFIRSGPWYGSSSFSAFPAVLYVFWLMGFPASKYGDILIKKTIQKWQL